MAYFLYAIMLLLPADGRARLHVKYSYPGGKVFVTFDPARSTRAELDSWMRLSPDLSADNNLLVPIDLRRCLPEDKRYVECGKNEVIHLENIDTNISEIKKLRDSLNPLHYPSDLRPVTLYLEEIENFSLWRAHRQRDALARRTFAPLRDAYKNLASSESCNVVLQKASGAKEDKRFEDTVLVDWANCVWKMEMDRVGPYPHKQWDAFLISRGITEKVVEEVPED